MGWFLFFVGLVLAPVIGWFLIVKRRADLLLTLLGVASIPPLIWGASLGAKIGSCGVPDCMSSAEHSRLVLSIPALALLLVALGLLAAGKLFAGGGVLVVAEALGGFSTQRTDSAVMVAMFVLGAAALVYLAVLYFAQRDELRVPDYPPPA
ncbi:MAG TPA: hypothetical protein VFL87_00305 [Thermoleophilaceae bacterium]|nr:hypothetical protein [Thermoleophilaceae bacterium]